MRGEHFSYALATFYVLIAHMFNRAICPRFPHSWTMYTIAPILTAGDPIDLSNYRTIMVGHILSNIYGSMIERELNILAKREGL